MFQSHSRCGNPSTPFSSPRRLNEDTFKRSMYSEADQHEDMPVSDSSNDLPLIVSANADQRPAVRYVQEAHVVFAFTQSVSILRKYRPALTGKAAPDARANLLGDADDEESLAALFRQTKASLARDTNAPRYVLSSQET